MKNTEPQKEFFLIEKHWIENALKVVEDSLKLHPESNIPKIPNLILKTLLNNSLKSSVSNGLDSIIFKTEFKKDEPYIKLYRLEEDLLYNPDFGDDRKCECGHPYHRHFDSYEDNEAVGCKYCQCFYFKEKPINNEL